MPNECLAVNDSPRDQEHKKDNGVKLESHIGKQNILPMAGLSDWEDPSIDGDSPKSDHTKELFHKSYQCSHIPEEENEEYSHAFISTHRGSPDLLKEITNSTLRNNTGMAVDKDISSDEINEYFKDTNKGNNRMPGSDFSNFDSEIIGRYQHGSPIREEEEVEESTPWQIGNFWPKNKIRQEPTTWQVPERCLSKESYRILS